MFIGSQNHATLLYETVSSELTEALKIPPDLSFMCKDKMMVHTHRLLLATFSPFMRSLFSSLDPFMLTSLQVLSVPGVSSTAMEELLTMISKPWGQQSKLLSSELIDLLRILGITVLPFYSQDDDQTHSESLSNLFSIQSTKEPTDVGFSPKNNYEDRMGADEDTTNFNIDVCEPKCIYCDTVFRDRTQDSEVDVLVHLGEVHFEKDLFIEQRRIFSNGSNKCAECNDELNGDYIQREHILLEHPWSLLKSTVDEILQKDKLEYIKTVDRKVSSDEAINRRNMDTSKKDHDKLSIKTTLLNNESNINLIKSVDDFTQMLSYKRDKPITEHLELQNHAKVTTADKEIGMENLKTSSRRITVTCTKCAVKWTYHSGTRMSDLRSRMKTHVVDLHFQDEMINLLRNNFDEDVCKMCDETVKHPNLKKKHLRKSHNALESDVVAVVEAILGDDYHKKDKRKGSPKMDTRRQRAKTSDNNSEIIQDVKEEILLNSNFRENDDLENVSNFRNIFKPNLNSGVSQACLDIQEAIEFSDSDDDD